MSYVLRQRPWRLQPPPWAEIDAPWLGGVVNAWNFANGVGTRPLVGSTLTYDPTNAFQAGADGSSRGLRTVLNGFANQGASVDSPATATTQSSFLWVGHAVSNSGSNNMLLAGSGGVLELALDSGRTVTFHGKVTSSGVVSLNAPTVIIASHTNFIGGTQGQYRLWLNGQVDTFIDNTGWGNAFIGGVATNAGWSTADAVHCVIVEWQNRYLSDAESQALSANPWQIFRPTQRRVYSLPAAGGTFQAAWAVQNNSVVGVGVH